MLVNVEIVLNLPSRLSALRNLVSQTFVNLHGHFFFEESSGQETIIRYFMCELI